MKSKNRILAALGCGSAAIQINAALLFLLAAVGAATAQDVFAPRPEFPVAPPALQQFQTSELEVFSPAGTPTSEEPASQPFRWGPVNLRPHVFYRFLYVDGILAQTNMPVTTVMHEVAPGFLLELGSHWNLDYTPTWRFYSDKNFQDTLDHSVRLTGGTAYEDWIFGLSQAYVSSSTPLIETGTQTEQETYSTALNASYRMNSKMSLDLGIGQMFRYTRDFQNSREWSTLDWLNYQFFPRLDVAIGAGFGYVDVDTGPDMTYEQLQGRINWRATDKISFQIHGGAEDRQFLTNGVSDLINPVLGVVVQYQPFTVTKISVHANRVVAVSYFLNQVVESTSVGGSLNQRLFNKLYLDFGGEYHTDKYVDTANSVFQGRTDDYYSLNVRLSYLFLKHGTFAVLYQYSDNSSSQSGFAYLSRQVGIELGYRF